MYDISDSFRPEPYKKPTPPQITASQVKFDLLNIAYNMYMDSFYKRLKEEEKEYLCDVSLFLSGDVNTDIVDKYLGIYFKKKNIIDKDTQDRIRNLLIDDSIHYYPTVLEDGTVKWSIQAGDFVTLVNKINMHCDNKLNIPTIDAHLTKRNPEIKRLKMSSAIRHGAFQPEIYYEPKTKSENTEVGVEDIDIDIDIKDSVSENTVPENTVPENTDVMVVKDGNLVPKKRSFISRVKNWVNKGSNKVQPSLGGNSRKTKKPKTKKTKKRKTKKTKTKQRK